MPMKSWLMEVCSNSPTKRKLHDVCQPEDACHLLKEEDRPRKEHIEKMCSEGYFTKYATQSIYSEEEGYEDISHFQEKGCSFKFLFSMILSGKYSNPFYPFENLFSCHVPVHHPRCVSCHPSLTIGTNSGKLLPVRCGLFLSPGSIDQWCRTPSLLTSTKTKSSQGSYSPNYSQ